MQAEVQAENEEKARKVREGHKRIAKKIVKKGKRTGYREWRKAENMGKIREIQELMRKRDGGKGKGKAPAEGGGEDDVVMLDADPGAGMEKEWERDAMKMMMKMTGNRSQDGMGRMDRVVELD